MKPYVKIVTSNGEYKVVTMNGLEEYITELVNGMYEKLAAVNVYPDSIPKPIIESEDNSIVLKESLSDFITDANHRFVTDDQINSLHSAPSCSELDDYVAELRKDYKKELNEFLNNLFASRTSVDKLKHIIQLCKDTELDDIFESLLEFLKVKLDDHYNDGSHLLIEDRTNLDKLREFLKEGCCADWNANADSALYIKNKPTSLPANGGNADTINGLKVNQIPRRKTCSFVIKHANTPGTEAADHVFNNGDNIFDILSSAPALVDGGKVVFRSGCYRSDDWYFEESIRKKGTRIVGEGPSSVITGNHPRVRIGDCNSISDLSFENAEVVIWDEVSITNCVFDHCDIKLDYSSKAMISHNRFVNCKITYAHSNSLMFVNNFLTECEFKKLYNASNIVDNNIEC